MKQTVAIFDFDGTLSTGSSGLRFFRYLLGKKSYQEVMLRNLFWGMLYLSTRTSHYALNKVLGSILKDRQIEEVTQIAAIFSKKVMPKFHCDKIIQRLNWHQEQGHRCIIITGALEIYMIPWAKQIDVSEIIATKLETTSEGRLTGKVDDDFPIGIKKLEARNKLLGVEDNYITYAYGDNYSDRYILASANYAYWIRNPNQELDDALLDPKTHKKWKQDYLK